jgi:hypothetical protein
MPEVIEERAPSADFGKVPGRTTGLICRDLMCKDKPVGKVHEQPRWWHEPRTVPILRIDPALRASGAHVLRKRIHKIQLLVQFLESIYFIC